MATKRKIREKKVEDEVEKKSARMEDRLTNLPEDLRVRILSFLNTKQAVQTSVLSKTWVSLWTRNPVLEFRGFDVDNLYVFDKFVNRVLCLHDRSAMLDRLIFTRWGKSRDKILEDVFGYALSHGVKQLEAIIFGSRNKTWPVCLNTNSLESLASLKLQSNISMACPFLGPRSVSFKNLTVLYLKGALITYLQPLPVLEKLTLLNCDIFTEGKTLTIHARNLLDLTISGYGSLNCCELTTPRLRFFGYRGYDFPLVRIQEGVPLLDTMAIDFNGERYRMHVKKTFDDMLTLFCALPNSTSLTLFWSTVEILSFFQDELMTRKSPFRNLKCLKLDFRDFLDQKLHRPHLWPSSVSFEIPSDVKAYLFQESPNAEVTTLYPHYWEVWSTGHDISDYLNTKDILISF